LARALGRVLENGQVSIGDYEAISPGVSRRSLQRDLRAMVKRGGAA